MQMANAQTPTAALNTDPPLNVHDSAAYLGCSEQTVYRLVAVGEIRAVRIGRAIRIRRSALEAFIAAAETRG